MRTLTLAPEFRIEWFWSPIATARRRYARYRTDRILHWRYPAIVPIGPWSNAIALSLFAAESIVRDYLNGRALPRMLHNAAVRLAEARLVEGKVPVLDETLCKEIDDEAIAPRRSVEVRTQAANDPGKDLQTTSGALRRY